MRRICKKMRDDENEYKSMMRPNPSILRHVSPSRRNNVMSTRGYNAGAATRGQLFRPDGRS